MTPTLVFDTYWRFAAERHAMYLRRFAAPEGPWTDDPILTKYRFTNVYRVLDRVSQYLIREVIYRHDRSQDADEVIYRILLFKIFNKIETWEELERHFGPITIKHPSPEALDSFLSRLMQAGKRIYSAAYIMPSPKLGGERKHTNHIRLLQLMFEDRIYISVCRANSLSGVYERLRAYPGLGDFLAFQYTIDLNYSHVIDFSEMDLVVAGPGARDGISKCFADADHLSAEEIINYMVEAQGREFERRGLDFAGLFGRPLQPIDCQNIFCEISKYARAAHPDVPGVAGRTRIKQNFKRSPRPQQPPMLPPKWKILVPQFSSQTFSPRSHTQLDMFEAALTRSISGVK